MTNENIFPDDGDRLMTVKEAAVRLHTSPTFIRTLIANGELMCITLYKRSYIRKFTLNAFLDKHDGNELSELVNKNIAVSN